MRLDAITIPVRGVSSEQTLAMFQLMHAHYVNVSEPQFLADLSENGSVILLYEGSQLRGFTTQSLFDHEIQGKRLKILYSGDTIIDKSYWGSRALPVAWGRLMLSTIQASPKEPLYWLLTSKGYKTYRFLPVFFREFYPRFDVETPLFEKSLLESLGLRTCGDHFDVTAGVIRALPDAQRLREGVADIDERRLQDPHIAFFLVRNPGHTRGDELVCVARCHPDNVTNYIRRQL